MNKAVVVLAEHLGFNAKLLLRSPAATTPSSPVVAFAGAVGGIDSIEYSAKNIVSLGVDTSEAIPFLKASLSKKEATFPDLPNTHVLLEQLRDLISDLEYPPLPMLVLLGL